MKKKLNLNDIKVESFVTALDNNEKETVNGQAAYQQTGNSGPASVGGGGFCPSEVHQCPKPKRVTNNCFNSWDLCETHEFMCGLGSYIFGGCQ